MSQYITIPLRKQTSWLLKNTTYAAVPQTSKFQSLSAKNGTSLSYRGFFSEWTQQTQVNNLQYIMIQENKSTHSQQNDIFLLYVHKTCLIPTALCVVGQFFNKYLWDTE